MNAICRLCIAFLLVSSPVFAYQAATPTSPPPLSSALPIPASAPQDRNITLDVVVTGKDAMPVTGLRQQDFTVLDNGRPQPLLSFQAVELKSQPSSPAKVFLVIDAVNTKFSNVSYELGEVRQFFEQSPSTLPCDVSLLMQTDNGAVVLNKPTRDTKLLIATLDQRNIPTRFIPKSAGFYGGGERYALSLQTLTTLANNEVGKPGKKLVIWISPGWPLLSGPEVELIYDQQKWLFKSIVAISNGLRAAQMTVYSIDPLGVMDEDRRQTYFYENFLKGVHAERQTTFGDLALQVLAYQSGGLVLNSNNSVSRELSESLADASDYYVLSFRSATVSKPNQYRSLKAEIAKPGMTARTRTGYYAQPHVVP